MKFIDKTILAIEAEAIVSAFLKELKVEGEAYPKDLYSAFKSVKNEENILLQNLLTNLLLKEQRNRCCYCMRKLDSEDEEKTLEHLIPNKTKSKAIFDTYLNPETVLNDENVCFAEDFINKQETKFPPYPHTIAYHNLSVSCNGKISRTDSAIHCNLKRGDEYVKPFILYSKISAEFEYKPDGYVIWKDNDKNRAKDALDELGLNTERLRIIRRIWFQAVQNNFSITECTDIQKKEFLIKLEKEVPNDELGILNDFKNNQKHWNLLKKYDYFRLKFLARKLNALTPTESMDLIENFDSNLNKQTIFHKHINL
ncbi:hypothetical protein FACS189451_05190 [Bacteroidia bacterium]|nr:hypothetical protein FACS189451_05190 [Bacteroidia bacterium]